MADSNPHQDTVGEAAREWAYGYDWPQSEVAEGSFIEGAEWAVEEIKRNISKIWDGIV